MIKKISSVFVIFLLAITVGCEKNEQYNENVGKIQEELDASLKKLYLLEEENKKLTEEISQLQTFDKGQKTRIFDPHSINVGDSVFGFKVTEIEFTDYEMERVAFEGFFVMSGELVLNMVGDSRYILVCSKDEIIDKLPVPASWKLDNYNADFKGVFRLLSDDKVSEIIGDERAKKMSDSLDKGIEIRYKINALFDNYTYFSQPNTDVSSSLNLVTILSIEEFKL